MGQLLREGWQITDFKTQSHEKGMWVVFLLASNTPCSKDLLVASDEQIETVDGLYQIDSHSRPHDEV